MNEDSPCIAIAFLKENIQYSRRGKTHGRTHMRKYLILGLTAAALAACSGGDADANGDGKISGTEAKTEMASGGAMKMKAGEWETTVTFNSIDAKGLPAGAKDQMMAAMGKGVTVKSCLTQEQVDKPGADFFGTPQGSNCEFQQLDRSGNSMKVEMTCKPDEKTTLTSKMDGTFAETSYTMTMEQKASGMPTGDMTMKGKIEGKRLGDCPA
jgi:Protein of unknown function (DUF3617)